MHSNEIRHLQPNKVPQECLMDFRLCGINIRTCGSAVRLAASGRGALGKPCLRTDPSRRAIDPALLRNSSAASSSIGGASGRLDASKSANETSASSSGIAGLPRAACSALPSTPKVAVKSEAAGVDAAKLLVWMPARVANLAFRVMGRGY